MCYNVYRGDKMIQATRTTLWCDYPIKFDSYRGCGFGCHYCYSINRDVIPTPLTSVREVVSFIKGKRSKTTNWCDWMIPLRWGVMSDPFQPCELEYRRSLQILKEFADRYYPFIVCTKSTMLQEPEYFDLIKECNCVLQVTACTPRYSQYEPNAPSFEERLKMIEKLSKVVKRVIVRIQPYIPHIKDDVISQIPLYKNVGVYGLIAEGYYINDSKRVFEGMEKIPRISMGPRWIYDSNWLMEHFKEIKTRCKEFGIVFLAGQDDMRDLGDYRDCCVGHPLKDFIGNKWNINYDCMDFPDIMNEPYTGHVFKHLSSDADYRIWSRSASFKHIILSARFAKRMDELCSQVSQLG